MGRGIGAINDGTGALTITAADVTTVIGDAILALLFNRAATSDITIDTSAGTVIGGNSGGAGINARNFGTGGISITAGDISNTISNANSPALFAHLNNAEASGDISITARNVSGGGGITVFNAGSGIISITSGDVSASGGIGIVSAANTGETRITLGSGATVMASGGAGISARSYGGAEASISLRTAEDATVESSITGSTDGVAMVTQGGDISITELASVTGNAGDGIDTTSGGGAITISAVGTVTWHRWSRYLCRFRRRRYLHSRSRNNRRSLWHCGSWHQCRCTRRYGQWSGRQYHYWNHYR